MRITESYDGKLAQTDSTPADKDRDDQYAGLATIDDPDDGAAPGHSWSVRVAQAWKYARMTNARALARVHEDLAAGHPKAAVRRLRAMLAKDSTDLEAYQLLAEIHRRHGDAAEAGRWGYITDEVTDQEISAFEQTHPQAWIRLQLIGWSGDPRKLPSDAARARLRALKSQAIQATIPTQRNPGNHGQGAKRRAIIPGQRHPGGTGPQPGTQRQPQSNQAGPRNSPPHGNQQWAATPSEIGQSGFARRVGMTRRPPGSPFRTYAMLMLLIIGGSVGSVIAVAGIRAVFGVKNWFSPVESLISTIARVLTD